MNKYESGLFSSPWRPGKWQFCHQKPSGTILPFTSCLMPQVPLNMKLCNCECYGFECMQVCLSAFCPVKVSVTHWLMQLWYLKYHRANPEECLLHSYKSSHKNVNSLVRSHERRLPHLTCTYSCAPFSKVTCKSSKEQSSRHFSKPYRSNSTPVPESNLFKLTNSLPHFNPKLEHLDYSMVLGDCLGFVDYHLDTAP